LHDRFTLHVNLRRKTSLTSQAKRIILGRYGPYRPVPHTSFSLMQNQRGRSLPCRTA
jgi:hypothetical protein